VADRLVVDLGGNGQVEVLAWLGGGLPEPVSSVPFAWPLDADALEDLRWYLEDYLLAPFGVWEARGPAVRGKLTGWGDEVFTAMFGTGPARDAYQRARDRGLEVVFRSNVPGLLALPWELMRDGGGPVALGSGGISRSLPVADKATTLEVPDGRLRVLMVISRPEGTDDIEYQMIVRPLLKRLEAVRGEVDLVVLRPPTLDALREALTRAAEVNKPFQIVHFDGHGALPNRPGAEGVLGFERPDGGSDHVTASRVAAVLKGAGVPVVVLNACQSGAVGKNLAAATATRLLREGCAAVVAMAYSVYAVAAAEFMAVFYERLFAGDTVSAAVTAGRRRLFENDRRPSPKGELPLEDWLVPVHYMRKDVSFTQGRTSRRAATPSLDDALDQIRAGLAETTSVQDPLAAVGVFMGRDDLFYQMEAAARLQRVVVLTGQGGAGKTELAKGFARWWRDTGGVDDPRLASWHSFEPGVASFGLDGVITAFGLEVFGADFALLDPAQRLAAVKQLLTQHRGLLVWDNFESVAEMPDPAGATPPLDQVGRTQLREFLDWVRDHSKSTVIITSRAREGWLGQVRRIAVGGLNRAEAAQYAGYLLAPFPAAQQRRVRRSFGELLEWLDGHPLAMRLTLPRLEDTDPADLITGLRGVTPLLGEDEALPGRLSSLGACITYSFTHLTGEARRLLPAVSLFHGIVDENLLTAMSLVDTVPARFAGISRQEWTAVLQNAAQVGLLADLGGSSMYQVHPALPGYLAAGWHADNPDGYSQEWDACEQALRTACADLSRWFIEQIMAGDAALAYMVIGLQQRTLGAMLGHALDHQAWNDADHIARALDAYWQTRGLSEESSAWTDRILNAVAGPGVGPTESASSLWLYAISRQGARQRDAGQLDQAAQTYQRALAWLQNLPADEWASSGIAVSYYQLGMLAQARGRLDEAEDWYRKALAIEEALADRAGIAGSYHQLGVIEHLRGRLDEAEDWFHKALAITEELGDRPHIAVTYHDLGVTEQTRGRLDEAEDWYRKALAIKEELGDRPQMAITDHQLGMLAQDRGRLDEAEDWYRKALAIEEALGDRAGMLASYHQLGIIAHLRGRLDEAEDWFRKALAIEEELGDRSDMAVTYQQLGLLAEARAQASQALAWNIRCVTLFEEFPSPLTRTGPSALARLTRQLGMPALERTWQQITGHPVPQQIRDYISSPHNDESSQP
jgi:tetratricopeptide (TPR) repeat protein